MVINGSAFITLNKIIKHDNLEFSNHIIMIDFAQKQTK